jgi:hypothetical protein
LEKSPCRNRNESAKYRPSPALGEQELKKRVPGDPEPAPLAFNGRLLSPRPNGGNTDSGRWEFSEAAFQKQKTGA